MNGDSSFEARSFRASPGFLMSAATRFDLKMSVLDSSLPRNADIGRAVSALAEGGVAIYPTETFYALGGDPNSESAVKRIFVLKGRNFSKPLPLIASDRSAILRVASRWPEAADRLTEAFWPGPLSLLLPAAPCLSPLLHAHTGVLAVRISPHPVAASLAKRLGGLIISTSANLSGEPPCRSVDEIPSALRNGVDVIVSAGELAGLLPSTIVDMTQTPPLLVREGAISWDAVRRTLGL